MAEPSVNLALIQDFLSEFLSETPVTPWAFGAVAAVNADGTLNVKIGGSSVATPNLRRLASYGAPAVNDYVLLGRNGPDYWVIDKFV